MGPPPLPPLLWHAASSVVDEATLSTTSSQPGPVLPAGWGGPEGIVSPAWQMDGVVLPQARKDSEEQGTS